MKKKHLSKKMILTLICLILEVLILITGGTLAIYMSQDHQRSVVRNRDNDTIRFSSDKLYRVVGGTEAQKYYYPMGKDARTMTFSVCNYDQAKSTLFNEKRIEYDISFQVSNGTDGFQYEISNGKKNQTIMNGNSVSFTGDSLTGGKMSANSYTFTFSEGDFNKVELLVEVTPKDQILTQNRILNGILIPIEYATTQGVTVKSEFTDSTRAKPDQFDAYNFAVSISGGSGNVLITWNSAQLDIDPFFQEGKHVTSEGNFSTITVPMNSEDVTGTYLIQFYNHNTMKPDWNDWTDLPINAELEESST